MHQDCRLPRWIAGLALCALAAACIPAGSLRASDRKSSFPPPTPGRVFSADRDGNCLLVNRDGVVVTSNHVVAGCENVVVSFCGTEKRFAGVVGVADSSADLALIQLTDFAGDGAEVCPAVFADSTVEIAVGDEVRINPADRQGRCDAGVFGRVYSLRSDDERISAFGLFNGHSGAALVQRGPGLVVGTLQASEAAWSEGEEQYLMPPYRYAPASAVCEFLDRAGARYSADHPAPAESWWHRLAGPAAIVGLSVCAYASTSEHMLADDYYDRYSDTAGWESAGEVRSLRLAVEDHDERSQYWLGAAVVIGAAALWHYEVPQRIWGQLTRLAK